MFEDFDDVEMDDLRDGGKDEIMGCRQGFARNVCGLIYFVSVLNVSTLMV